MQRYVVGVANYPLVGKVYGLLTVSLALTVVGSWIGMNMPVALYLPALILEIALFIGLFFTQKIKNINIVNLLSFTTLSGVTLGPTIAMYTETSPGVVPMAAGCTGLIFGALSLYVHITKSDFSWMGGILFVAVLGLLGIMLFSLFLPVNMTLVAGGAVLLFSLFILYDTSRLIHTYTADEYVWATVAIYLDIINLFIWMLRLLGGFRSND